MLVPVQSHWGFPASQHGVSAKARLLPAQAVSIQIAWARPETVLTCVPTPASYAPRRWRRMRARCAPAFTVCHAQGCEPCTCELRPSCRWRRMRARCAPAAARWRGCTCAACWRALSCACCCLSWPSARAWCAGARLSSQLWLQRSHGLWRQVWKAGVAATPHFHRGSRVHLLLASALTKELVTHKRMCTCSHECFTLQLCEGHMLKPYEHTHMSTRLGAWHDSLAEASAAGQLGGYSAAYTCV